MDLKIEFDRKGLTKVKQKLEQLAENHIEYGVLGGTYPAGDPRHRDGLSIAFIAYLNEHGFGMTDYSDGLRAVIPREPRPFFAQSIPFGEMAAGNWLSRIATLALTGQNIKVSLNKMAIAMAATVKYSIQNGTFAENAPRTISQKGGRDTPLRDTDTLLNSISGIVVTTKK